MFHWMTKRSSSIACFDKWTISLLFLVLVLRPWMRQRQMIVLLPPLLRGDTPHGTGKRADEYHLYNIDEPTRPSHRALPITAAKIWVAEGQAGLVCRVGQWGHARTAAVARLLPVTATATLAIPPTPQTMFRLSTTTFSKSESRQPWNCCWL